MADKKHFFKSSASAEIRITFDLSWVDKLTDEDIFNLSEKDRKTVGDIKARRIQKLFNEAEERLYFNTLEYKYQVAIRKGLENVLDDIFRLKRIITESRMDNKYRESINFQIERLQHLRKKDFLNDKYKLIDSKIEELKKLRLLMDEYWNKN